LRCDEGESTVKVSFLRESPFIIVCEGFHDVCFICNLLRHLRITNCDVTFPKKIEHGGNGKDRITSVLKGLAGRIAGLEGVMVLWDADADANASFAEAAKSFLFQNSPFIPPPTPFAIHPGTIKTAVFLTPGTGRTGTLEHLMLDAANDHNRVLQGCIDQLCLCSSFAQRGLSDNDEAKAKLAIMVAASCDEPTCSLAWIWNKRGNPVPIDSARFTELSDFIRLFTSNQQMGLPTP